MGRGLGGGAGCVDPMSGGGASLMNPLGIPRPVVGGGRFRGTSVADAGAALTSGA